MSYDPNIPQASDVIATSQGQLLTNFGQLNSVYGTSGDHYAYDNATPGEQNLHAKVTLPRLPTANPPGNVLPTPAAGITAIFSQAAGGQSNLYYRRDGLTTNYPLSPIKSYVNFTTTGANGAQTINQSFNIASVSQSGGGTAITITLTNPMQSGTYGVLISNYQAISVNSSDAEASWYTITDASNFVIRSHLSSLLAGINVTAITLEV